MSVYPLCLARYNQFCSKFRGPILLRQHLYTSKMHSITGKTHFPSSFKCAITLRHGLFALLLFMLLITDVTLAIIASLDDRWSVQVPYALVVQV